MIKYLYVLLLGGLFFTVSMKALAADKTTLVYNDILIFMIKDKVFSLDDLKQTQKALKDFECMYPESYVTEYFKLITKKFDTRVFDKSKISKNEKTKKFEIYLGELLKFLKMSVYSKEQSVSIANELEKAIILSARTKRCSMELIENNKLSSSLIDVLGVEVFFRSRNISNPQKENSQIQREKALSSLDSLAKSIVNQIDHTQFESSYE